tara:strand:- start:571 stop:2190 length:1620 start_codon:yes stop_codon:yes gene_type:complete
MFFFIFIIIDLLCPVNQMKTLNLSKILSDDEVKNIKGHLINESHIKHNIVDVDTDCYTDDGRLLFKFRKNIIPPELCKVAWDNYRTLAKPSRGRGASAGQIDPNNNYWKNKQVIKTSGISTKYLIKGKETKMRVNNQVASQPIGYFESTKSLGVDLPCRLTHYAKSHLEQFEGGFEYLIAVDESYKNLNPDKHKLQLDRARLKPDFQIQDTAFSTFTINRNFQTSVHKDAGDFGFGNLTVLERGKYNGGYFVLPQYGIAIDLRQGDHLCVDVHEYHGNTKMLESVTQNEYNVAMDKVFKDNIKVGTEGLDKLYTRISFVFYLRENIAIKCNVPTKFVINLDRQPEKMTHHKNVIRWSAVDGQELNMVSISKSKLYMRSNTKEPKSRGIFGCLMSHVSLLEHIVERKLTHVCVLEDDSTSDFVLDDSMMDTKHITYLGGWLVNKKMKDVKLPVEERASLVKGINHITESRVLTTRAYYIPHYKYAQDLLDHIYQKKTWRAIDIMMSEFVKDLYYPALSKQILGYESTIGNMKPKEDHEFY